MTVTASTITPASSTPDADDLWALAHLVAHDWSAPVKLTTSYDTRIDVAGDGSETRRGLLRRPRRLLRARLAVHGVAALNRLDATLTRYSMARSLVPLYCDQTWTTSGSSTTVINCDTTHRRFQAGARVVIAQPQARSLEPASIHVARVASVADDALTLNGADAMGVAPGERWRVYPLIEAELGLEQSATLTTDRSLSVAVEAREDVGATRLEPTVGANSTPAGATTYSSRPVLNPRPMWDVQERSKRLGTRVDVGRGYVLDVRGARPTRITPLRVRTLARSDAFDLLRMFDSRVGRLHALWWVDQAAPFSVTAITSTTIDVTAVGQERDWTERTHVAVVERGGTVQVRAIDGVSRSSGVDTITLDASITAPSLPDVRRVATARLARFGSDQLVETWTTDAVAELSTSVAESLSETAVSLSDLP